MNRQHYFFQISPEELDSLKVKVLHYISEYNTFTFFDNNHFAINPRRFEFLAAAGIRKKISFAEIPKHQDWIFFQFDYEFNPLAPEDSNCQIIIPETVIYCMADSNDIHIESVQNPECIQQDILKHPHQLELKPFIQTPTFQSQIAKKVYLDTIEQIRDDIYWGKYYELNYCVPFEAQVKIPDTKAFFYHFNKKNPAPMAAYLRQGHRYLFCSSPERFVFTDQSNIIVQPIKGTAPRGYTKAQLEYNTQRLQNSIKDRAENVMIVDLTRNDLSRICEIGSVQVPELFGIYPFQYLIQMISTIQGRLKPNIAFTDIWKAVYPMGSMTGAPKPTVIDHISKYEQYIRGMYSGSVGYIQPNGNIDSNVVIRSLEYNHQSEQVIYKAGGAITYQSDAQSEWDEVLLKSKSMMLSFNTPL